MHIHFLYHELSLAFIFGKYFLLLVQVLLYISIEFMLSLIHFLHFQLFLSLLLLIVTANINSPTTILMNRRTIHQIIDLQFPIILLIIVEIKIETLQLFLQLYPFYNLLKLKLVPLLSNDLIPMELLIIVALIINFFNLIQIIQYLLSIEHRHRP